MRPELGIPCGVLVLCVSGLGAALLVARFRLLDELSVFAQYRRAIEQLRGEPAFDSSASIRQMRMIRVAGWVLAVASLGLLVTWIASLMAGRVALAKTTGEWGAVLLPVSIGLIWMDIYNRRYMAKHHPGGSSAHAARRASGVSDLLQGPVIWVPLGAMVVSVLAMGLLFRSWQIAAVSAAVLVVFTAPFAVAYVRSRRRVSGR